MTELDKIFNRPDHRLNWMAEVGIDQIQLDGSFTKEQLLELAYAMETPDSNPVVYTGEMAAEDEELLANVPTPLNSMANTRLTEAHVEDFLSNYRTREDALRLLQEMGQVDEHGNLTPPYQPVPESENRKFDSGVKTRSLKDYADLHTEQILAIKEWLDTNLDWIELEEVYLEAASFDALFMSEADRPRDSLKSTNNG